MNSLNLFVYNFVYYGNCFYFSEIIYIFVINYPGNNTATVEKFRFDEKRQTLNHVQTYQDATFTRSVVQKVTPVLLNNKMKCLQY